MSIANFYNKTVSTKRLGDVVGSNKETFATNLSSLECAIHPLDPKQVLLAGSSFYQTYKMYCAETEDIVIGDQLIDGSDVYVIQSVALYDDINGSNKHAEAIIVKGE